MKNKQTTKKLRVPVPVSSSQRIITDIRRLIEGARERVASYANAELTMVYWQVGERIRRETLKEKRVEYGEEVLPTQSAKLEPAYGNETV